ncbi:uncharacterized protein N7496_012242 [Penicillium cataractarum]|uniref:Uncharacterized protein n=1 Tax=Penicillium cataractarum TaxID=2100454 RepID=A0A9W9UTN1_9EURO|nr:uncharacterized protein N7496_012242 [Penicillium cataractarum]KAJ5355030.1 hypothetical protein N7496_012242 [Penicillium cataractarum]
MIPFRSSLAILRAWLLVLFWQAPENSFEFIDNAGGKLLSFSNQVGRQNSNYIESIRIKMPRYLG